MKMLSVILVIFLLSGFIEAEEFEKYGKRGKIIIFTIYIFFNLLI